MSRRVFLYLAALRRVYPKALRSVTSGLLVRKPGAALLLVLGLTVAFPGLAASTAITRVSLIPRESGEDAFATFGVAFRKGDVRDSLHLESAGRTLESQIDIRRRYEDGSVKHALVSVRLPEVTLGENIVAEVVAAPSPSGRGEGVVSRFPEGLDARVLFKFPDGTESVASLKDMYASVMAGDSHFRLMKWLDGALVTEYQLAGPPRDSAGKSDPDLSVIFGVRTFRGKEAARIEVVVENCWIDSPGNVPYEVAILVLGKEVFSQDKVGYLEEKVPYWCTEKPAGHPSYARWRKLFYWGEKLPEVFVRLDPSYLVQTGLIPRYRVDIEVSEKGLDRQRRRWESSRRGILENGIIEDYFPTTGGREDIGPYPAWTARYLLSQEYEAFRICLGTGDLAGSFPVHMRDRKTGRIVSIDEHPGFSLNKRGSLQDIHLRKAEDRPYLVAPGSPYQVDCAHQPSLAFVPYLVTGDFYYLEEAYFWADWCMLIQNAAYRGKEQGLLRSDQVRGQAWALRQLVDAAKIAPNDHPEKSYFHRKVGNNVRYYLSFISGPDATPLGTYTAGGSDAYVRGRAPEERRQWVTLAPWQQNFLAWALDHAVLAGYEEAAAAREYFLRCQLGMLTNPGEYAPSYATPYFLVVGGREGDQVRYYRTWKELFDKTFRVVSPDTEGGIQGGDYGGSYGYIARAVLGIALREKMPGAEEARRFLDDYLPRREEVLAEDPTWALAP